MHPPGVLFVVCLETSTESCCGLLFSLCKGVLHWLMLQKVTVLCQGVLLLFNYVEMCCICFTLPA